MALAQKKASVSADRRNMLAKVHIAKKQLGLDDHIYRGLLRSRFNKDSAAKLTDRQLHSLVKYFESQGWKAKRSKKAGSKQPADHDTALKMRALWISLYHLGVVRDPSEKALSAYAKRVTGGKNKGIASLKWVKDHHAYKVIEALKDMATREAEVDWSPHHQMGVSVGKYPRKRIVEAQLWCFRDGGITPAVIDALAPIGGTYDFNNFSYKDEDLDKVIASLGEHVRMLKAE